MPSIRPRPPRFHPPIDTRPCRVSTDAGLREVFRQGHAAGYAQGYEAARAVFGLSQERIRALLELCDPTRHHGLALAKQITAWLKDQQRPQRIVPGDEDL